MDGSSGERVEGRIDSVTEARRLHKSMLPGEISASHRPCLMLGYAIASQRAALQHPRCTACPSYLTTGSNTTACCMHAQHSIETHLQIHRAAVHRGVPLSIWLGEHVVCPQQRGLQIGVRVVQQVTVCRTEGVAQCEARRQGDELWTGSMYSHVKAQVPA